MIVRANLALLAIAVVAGFVGGLVERVRGGWFWHLNDDADSLAYHWLGRLAAASCTALFVVVFVWLTQDSRRRRLVRISGAVATGLAVLSFVFVVVSSLSHDLVPSASYSDMGRATTVTNGFLSWAIAPVSPLAKKHQAHHSSAQPTSAPNSTTASPTTTVMATTTSAPVQQHTTTRPSTAVPAATTGVDTTPPPIPWSTAICPTRLPDPTGDGTAFDCPPHSFDSTHHTGPPRNFTECSCEFGYVAAGSRAAGCCVLKSSRRRRALLSNTQTPSSHESFAHRWLRDAVAMSVLGLMQTVPIGALLVLFGFSSLPLVCGSLCGLVSSAGFLLPSALPHFSQGVEIAEFLSGFWLWFCIAISAFRDTTQVDMSRKPIVMHTLFLGVESLAIASCVLDDDISDTTLVGLIVQCFCIVTMHLCLSARQFRRWRAQSAQDAAAMHDTGLSSHVSHFDRLQEQAIINSSVSERPSVLYSSPKYGSMHQSSHDDDRNPSLVLSVVHTFLLATCYLATLACCGAFVALAIVEY